MQSSSFELNVLLTNDKYHRDTLIFVHILLSVKMDCGLLGPCTVQMTAINLLWRSIMKKTRSCRRIRSIHG